jgi:hypothetical protein
MAHEPTVDLDARARRMTLPEYCFKSIKVLGDAGASRFNVWRFWKIKCVTSLSHFNKDCVKIVIVAVSDQLVNFT